MIFFIHFFIYYARKEKTINFASVSNKNLTTINFSAKMKKNFKLLLLTLIMGGGLFASEAMAIEPVNGVYQIGTADDFEAFAKLINEGNSNPMKLNAVLTADIDLRSKGNCMIGTIGHTYGGEFDGQGHTITIDYKHENSLSMDEGELGLIRRLRDGTVKNLLVNGNITTCNKCAGGIVSGIWYTGTIENCVSNVTITDSGSGDATHGGILARISNKSNILIKNCAFYGTIEASNREGSGGIIGWADYGNSENAETKIMNCVMGGTLHLKKNKDNDVFVRNNVSITNSYYVAQQDMNNTNNTSVSQKDLNALKNALGSDWSEIYSGAAPLPKQFVPTINNNYYELSTASHMRQFAELVNNSNNSANGKMMNDINLSNIWTPIGNNDHRYAGTFDGQFHMINNLTVDLNQENVGIFGIVQSCTIKNLISGPNNSFKGTKGVGGIIGKGDGGGDNGIKLTCVGNESAVYATSQDAGGLIGYVVDQTQNVTITNCYNTGDVKAGNNENNHEAAAIAGWLGRKTVSIKGFWNTGSITGSEYGNALWRNGDGSVTKERIYNLHNTDNEATMFTQDQLSNGELCYLLNGSLENPVWYQTIGTDVQPVPFSNGHQVVHNTGNLYNNHFDNADYVNITSPDDLVAFANAVNLANYYNVQAKLSSNLDMSSQSSNFPCIGSENHPFCGVFDGQNHIISNLNVDLSSQDGVGLFGTITGPHSDDYSTQTIIKNITIDKTCSFKGKQGVAGIAGRCVVNGNNPCGVQFLQCGNEADVTATTNAAGILGVNIYYQEYYNYVRMTLINCYNTGDIEGHECGGLSGWLGDNQVTLTNCYSTGTVTEEQNGGDSDAFCRWNNKAHSVTNCYSLNDSGRLNYQFESQNSETDAANFKNGTVFASLFAYVDGSVWRWETEGTPHPVLYGNKIAMNENCTNRMVAGDYDVTLYRTIKAGGWNTVCMPFAMNSDNITDYFGKDAKVAMLDETKDDNDNVLHFKSVDEITAGQAYLVYPSEGFTQKSLGTVTIAATAPSDGLTQAGFTFQGVFDPTELTANTDRIVAGGTSIVKTSGGTLKGFRAYFKTAAGARATSFVIDDDETTGIITPEGEVIVDAPVYNLGGQRVNKPQRGLYIVNGKKVVIK